MVMVWTLCPANGGELDETVRSAVFLLESTRKAGTTRQAQRAGRMLRALRQMADPELQPFFLSLLEQDNALLTVHALLGLAECSTPRRLDPQRLRLIKRPTVQQMALAAAADLSLIELEQARDLMNDGALHVSVRVLAAAIVQRFGEQPDLDLLHETSRSGTLDQSALAALLLLQRGDRGGIEALNRLNASSDAQRDRVRQNLLSTALGWKFDRIGAWALAIAADQTTESRLARLALQVALRFDARGATEQWRKRYAQATDLVGRTREGLVALQAAHWIDPALFTPLTRSREPTVARIGRVGAAVAARREVVDAVIALIEANHARLNRWALEYARDVAEQANAQPILLALILAFDGSKPGRDRALQVVVAATEALADMSPETARPLLRPMLVDPASDARLVRGILAGLVGCRKNDPYAICADLPGFGDPTANQLVLLISARHDHPLDDDQMERLAQLTRGAGGFSPHLRLQAAWSYLRRTGQTRLALAEVLETPTSQ